MFYSESKNKINISLVVIALFIISFSPFLELSSNNSKNSQQIPFNLDNPKTNANEIIVITPENKTYSGPMAGYYPATYGFENEIVGTAGDDIGFVDTDVSSGSHSLTIISEYLGHENIIEFWDGGATGNYASIFNDVNATEGTIEYWVAIEDASEEARLRAHSSGGTGMFGVTLIIDKWQVLKDGGWSDISGIDPPQDGEWYHVRLDFRCSTNPYDGLSQYEFNVHINGVEYGNYGFFTDIGSIGLVYMTTQAAGANYKFYMDAVGYSWDPNYNIGDNLKEGLLLSYSSSVSLNWTGYSLDYQANKTILGNTTIPFPSEGLHTIQVFGNDSIGIMYQSEITYFSVDVPPIIIINLPNLDDIFGPSAPSFNISIVEPLLDETWYTLDNGVNNLTFIGLTGTINQTEWNKQGSGLVTIRFYANSTSGLENYKEVIVIKDAVAPIITFNIPNENEFFAGNSPSFNITIDELSLNSTWYTLDNGIHNFTFIGLTGPINQTEWNKQGDGPVTLRFYAKDSYGYQNYSEIILHKDITDPVLTIFSPIHGDRFTTIPPVFNIDVDELNIERIWYTIDGGLNNYNITQFTSYIDSDAWNVAPIGAITIRFSVEDKAGNLEYIDIIIQKSTPSPPPPPLNINLIIIIGVIAFIGISFFGGFV
ncbi:MAG TPA: hypothetical protein ENI29_22570, partial [bacterium]|nr:hypothetical protein [bacterium]